MRSCYAADLMAFATTQWACVLSVAPLCMIGCTDLPAVDCGDPGANCTLRMASEQAGVFMGTTSEAAGWSTNEIGTLVKTHFSSVTSQNELKWGALANAPGVYDFDRADETVDFAEENGLRIRGHTLFWHRLNGPPAWLADELDSASDREARLRDLMQEHVQTVVGRYEGRIDAWDVVNEPLALFGADLAPDSIFFQTFENDEDFLDLAFELARQADPEAKLFINEIFPSINETTFNGLLDLVSGMLDRDVPIDGVGFQGHFVVALPNAEQLRQRLQAFSDLGLLVELTEVDVSINLVSGQVEPLTAQAEVYGAVIGACLAVRRCTGITTWNVHDGLTWLDNDVVFGPSAPHMPTIFDVELTAKPAYDAALAAFIK